MIQSNAKTQQTKSNKQTGNQSHTEAALIIQVHHRQRGVMFRLHPHHRCPSVIRPRNLQNLQRAILNQNRHEHVLT